ncbi:DUF5050 domain-containing protein [Coraliomargarita akajimensis]|nr:DUF5050 domain-containing protein [Coraliomargarita akajimensis]
MKNLIRLFLLTALILPFAGCAPENADEGVKVEVNADSPDHYIYFVTKHANASDKTVYSISRLGNNETVPTQVVEDAKKPICLSTHGQYLYWASDDDGVFYRARLDGSDVEPIGSRSIFNRLRISVSNTSVTDLAVTTDSILWSTGTYHSIQRADHKMNASEKLVSDGIEIVSMCVQGESIYYTTLKKNPDTQEKQTEIMRVGIDGGSPVSMVPPIPGYGVSIATGSNKLYWEAAGKLFSADLDGNNLEELATGFGAPRSIAAIDGFVYSTSSYPDGIRQFNISSKQTTDIPVESGINHWAGVAIAKP